MTLTSAAPVEVPMRKHGVFVDEMRSVAMKLHTREQARGGQKEAKGPEERSVAKWEPTIDGYLRFLVDSKLVFDALEGIVQKAAFPCYAEFRNTGLERSENLARDLEWFKDQGHTIPEPSDPGICYAGFLEDLSQKDPHAFVCHFYNIYFAHSAGGRMIGKKVAEKILDKKQLEFYKWDGDLPQLLQNVREKLHKVSEALGRIKFEIVRYRSDKCSNIELGTKATRHSNMERHVSRLVSKKGLDKGREGSLLGRDGEVIQVLGRHPSSDTDITQDGCQS